MHTVERQAWKPGEEIRLAKHQVGLVCESAGGPVEMEAQNAVVLVIRHPEVAGGVESDAADEAFVDGAPQAKAVSARGADPAAAVAGITGEVGLPPDAVCDSVLLEG